MKDINGHTPTYLSCLALLLGLITIQAHALLSAYPTFKVATSLLLLG